MDQSSEKSDAEFEESVRRLARLLWTDAALGGTIELDGRERDGYFERRDSIYIIEATTSRKKEKIKYDSKKTHDSILKLRNTTFKPVAGWIITREEPTPDQKLAANKYPTVRLLSFDQFRSLLFDGNAYLGSRGRYTFGSVRDVKSNNINFDDSLYVPLDISIDDEIFSTKDVKMFVDKGNKILLSGEYGSGKSVTLRELYKFWERGYTMESDFRVPLYLNLRDHFGQKKPVQALEHHAREIGYPGQPTDLVRAWRSGLCHLILDGFDELGTTGWGGTLNKAQAHREVAMTLVRNFISETPDGVNIIISGRENFFNNERELRKALGLRSHFKMASLAELSKEQTTSLLSRYGYKGDAPDWLRRALS